MRGFHQNGTGSGSALQQQGKNHHQRRRSLGARHLLRLLVLLAAQQGFTMVDGRALGRFILQPAAVVVGTLLAPQAAQAATTLTATPGQGGRVMLRWTPDSSVTLTPVGDWKYRQNGGPWILIPGGDGKREHPITGLTDGVAYSFQVQMFVIGPGDPIRQAGTLSNTVTATPFAPPVLSVKGNPDGGIVASWTYSGYFPAGGKWQYKKFPHPQGGTSFVDAGPRAGVAGLRTLNIIGSTTGVRFAVQVRLVDANGNEITRSNFALATPGGTAAPTLVSDPSKTVRVGPQGTILVCYNLVSVIHNGTTYLEKRPGKTAVPTSSELKNTVHGVEITEAPAVIRSSVVGVGNVNFDPCATVGPGVHSVTWQWNGLNGLASQTGRTTTTFTVLAANRPDKPAGFTATAGNGQVALAWNDPSDSGITRWEMQRKEGTGNYGGWTTISAGTSGGKLTHPVTGLTNGTEYGFRVRAVNANGVGLPSDEQTATPNNKTITLTADSTSITEGNTGTKDVTLTATLGEAAPAGGLGVWLGSASTSTASLSAICSPLQAGTDVCTSDNHLIITIAEGETRGTKVLKIIGDTADEMDETIKLSGKAHSNDGQGTRLTDWPESRILTITIEDDDTAGVTISEDTLTVNAGASKTYTVVLDSDPGAQVVVTPTSTPVAKATVSGALTFTTATNNWSTAQTVTVTGVAAGTATISHTVSGYTGVQNSDIEDMEVTVNAAPTIAVPVLTRAIGNADGGINLAWTHPGGSGAGDYAPGATSFYSWEMNYRLMGSTRWFRLGGSGNRCNNTNLICANGRAWSSPEATYAGGGYSIKYPDGAAVEVRIRAVGEAEISGRGTVLFGPWSNTRTVTIKNTANKFPKFTGRPVTVTGVGATATYTVELGKTSAEIAGGATDYGLADLGGTLSIVSANPDKATVSPPTLTFTASNYSTAQTVTVTGVAAGAATINHSFRLTSASADAIPQGDTVKVAVGTPTAGVTLSRKTLAVTEAAGAGNNATYTVRLNTAPTAQVVVTPTSGDAAVSVSGALTFTTSNYNDEQTVTVTGADDVDTDSETVPISHSAASTDNNYGSSLSIESVSVSVTDDDSATGSKPAAPTGLRAAAGNAQVTLTWEDPDDDDITEYKVRYGKKTARRNAEWGTIDDSDADTVTHTVTGLDNNAEYSFKVRAVSSAGDGTATDWVDATPVAPATIKPPEDLTIVPGPDRLYLSWTAPTDANRTGWRVQYRRREGVNWGEWSSWTAITDAAATNYDLTGLGRGYAHEVALEATGASSATSTAATAQGGTTADLVAKDSGQSLSVDEGGTASYEVKITSRPTGDVTITPSSANTDLSFDPTDLTFTTANWDTYQTLTVRAATDEDTNDEGNVRVSYTASGGGYSSTISSSRTINIRDTTPTLQLSTDPAAATEGTAISLTVTSDRALTGTLPVTLTLAARSSSTFTAADIDGTLGPRNFNAVFGDTAKTTGTVSIPTSTDADATEGPEAYRITLSDAAGYAVGTDVTADGVLNDGTAATVSVPATRTVAEGDGNAVVTITTPRAFGASTTFNVSYGSTSSTSDTDARGRGNPSGSNNGDYDNNDVRSVTFSPTEKTKAIEIPIRNDKLDEEDETFEVTIAAAATLPDGFSLGNAVTTVTITDDDTTPVLEAIEDVNLKQGQAVDITASASDADGDTVTYAWSRKSGEDSPSIPGGTALNAARLNFTPPGTGTYTMTVTASDGANEATEEVIITVSNANVVQVPERVEVGEGDGNAVVRIRTAEAFGQAVTFNVTYGSTSVTSDNDATGAATPASGDYDNDAVTSVSFGASDTSKDVVIPVTDDDLDEEDETFTVTIAPAAALPSGFQLARATTVVTITDDDNTPVLAAIENVTLKQGQAVDITASATDADGDSITYTWTRKDGESSPAIPGGTALNAARLNFTPPGTGTYTMTVTASDGANEATEEVVITVTDANVVQAPERVAVAEGDGNAVVPITTTEAFGQAVTFNVTYGSTASTTDNDATGASDPASGDYDNDAVTSVSFGASDTSKEILIPITDDQTVEGEETFEVTIAPAAALPGGFQLARATTVVTITDNDQPTGGGGSGSGSGGGSTPSSVPAAPTGVGGSAATTGNGQVRLTWSNPGDATISKWQVQRREISGPAGARLELEAASYRPGGQPAQQTQEGGSYGPWVDIPGSTASTTSYTVTDLTNGKTYGFRIRAVNAAGRPGRPSTEIRVTLRQAPLKPTGVTATPGNGQVTLAWNNPDNATITKWQVQRKEGSGSYGAWRDIPNSTASTTSHTVTGLTNGVAYSFRIRAVNAAGNGAPSDEVTATPIDQDMVQADKARSQALAATSRTLLGMATDVLGSRSGGEAPVALAGAGGSMGEQAMGIVEEVLGTGGSELPTSLTLEEVEDRLWSQSFQLTPPSAEEGSTGQQSWAFWGAGELRSYRSEGEEGLSSSGNLKTAWLGVDYPFTHRGLAGLALSFSTGQSDYTYRKTDGSTDGGRMDTRLTAFYPYGSFQVSRQLRLWAMAGIGWGSQHHQQTGDDAKAEGDLRLQMGVVGFEQALSPIGDVNLSLAGDAGLVKSTTTWQGGSGLGDLSVTLHRIRMGVDGSFPLAEHTTGYVNVKGRMDGGDLSMNAAELVAGVQYSQARFSGFLQGRQVYAFDGSYAESGLTAQLRLTANSDGTGLGWTLQPSYGAGTGNGDVALAAGPSLWTDEQLESLTGAGAAQQEGQHLEWSSRVGYGIRLESSDLLLTPFTEVRLWEGTSHRIGLGLTVEANSWNLEFSGSTEHTTNASPTGNLQLNFSKRL